MPPTLTRSRCIVHPEREAAARCIGCESFFCRECITEHDGRMLCVECHRKLSQPALESPTKSRSRPALGPLWLILQAMLGWLLMWALIAFIGVIILKMPEEVHDGSIWSPETWLE